MPGDDREASLDFPDLPRMELETVLEQLTERAEDVLRAQGRLRGLLRANAAVASELSLPMVLHRIVEVARDLVGARYAALGVIGTDGTLEEFVYAGMDEADADRIGQLPRGAGILGLLINDPEPLRLADLTEHPLAAGFPAGHPAMHAFLGVPIRVGDSVFGRLYLTEKAGGGEFTEEDEQLTISLAGTAGAAISNARMFAESEQRRRWLTASGELTPRLLGDEPVDAFELIARHAAEASEADFAAALIPVGESQLVVRAVVRLLADELADRLVPVEGSFAGEVLRSGKPTLITDYSTDPSAAPLSVVIGPVIVVPLIAGERIRGVLVLGRRAGQKALDALDLDMAASFARQAAVALELVDARVDQLNMARLEDHDRIARDLHDHVIQELFAAGMAIQSLASVIGNKAQVERVLNHVDTLDRVIARIRSTIFELRHDQQSSPRLADRLNQIVHEHAPQLGFAPTLEVDGLADEELDARIADDVAAVVREALSNCARHARASRVAVNAQREGNLVVIEVTDDGVGIPHLDRFSGLANLRERAERHGGQLQLTVPEGGGTRLVWTTRLQSD